MIPPTPVPTVAIVDPHWCSAVDLYSIPEARLEVFDSADAALRAVNQRQAGLWIVAEQLPDACGFELCQTLRDRLRPPVVYIVAAEYTVEQERRAREAGASCFLTKPVEAVVIEMGLRPASGRIGREGVGLLPTTHHAAMR